MSEVPKHGSQLDRIEGGINELNQRLARLEERQNHQGVKIESHEVQISEHSHRLREVELAHAVAAATHNHQGQRLLGRWAALGATALVVLGAVGQTLGKWLTDLLGAS